MRVRVRVMVRVRVKLAPPAASRESAALLLAACCLAFSHSAWRSIDWCLGWFSGLSIAERFGARVVWRVKPNHLSVYLAPGTSRRPRRPTAASLRRSRPPLAWAWVGSLPNRQTGTPGSSPLAQWARPVQAAPRRWALSRRVGRWRDFLESSSAKSNGTDLNSSS